MFVTTVCLLFLLKLKWPKNKSLYDLVLIVSELVPIRGGKTSSHAYKTGPWYLLEILFTISNEQPRLCYMGVPPPDYWIGGGPLHFTVMPAMRYFVKL